MHRKTTPFNVEKKVRVNSFIFLKQIKNHQTKIRKRYVSTRSGKFLVVKRINPPFQKDTGLYCNLILITKVIKVFNTKIKEHTQ